MTEMDAERRKIKAAIVAAFSNNPFPGDRPEQLIMESVPSERERLAPFFAGKRWDDWIEKPLDMLKPHPFSGGLIFLEPHAFRYYLPIFLLAGLIQPDEAGNVLNETIGLLSRDDSDWGRMWCSMMLKEMTQPQLMATMGALDYFDVKYGSFNPSFHKELERARTSLRRFQGARE